MKKTAGIFLVLMLICVVTTIGSPRFVAASNIQDQLRWTGLFGIMGIGVSFVIVTGGIDLSIGSAMALVGCLLAMLLKAGVSVPLALFLVMLVAAAIGLVHGLLITRLRLQPFVVTLFGLLFYRGIARYLASDNPQGFGSEFQGLKYLVQGQPFSIPVPFLSWISEGNWSAYQWNIDGQTFVLDAAGQRVPLDFWLWIDIPMPLLVMLIIAVAAAVFLNLTIYGRYLLALGRNEQAARFSGINTDRMVILAYVICSVLSGLAGVLFALDVNSVQPASFAIFYELYAIAAAVLGGCSLRGGEGSILGVVIGTTLVRVLQNSINMIGIDQKLEFAVVGTMILLGNIADELMKRYNAKRRARHEALAEVGSRKSEVGNRKSEKQG